MRALPPGTLEQMNGWGEKAKKKRTKRKMPEDLIRFDYVNSDGRNDSKMITHDEMRQRYADLLASNALSYRTGGGVPDDDALVQLALKFPGIAGVVYEQWKDGLSIDAPTADLRNFARALLATQQPPEQDKP